MIFILGVQVNKYIRTHYLHVDEYNGQLLMSLHVQLHGWFQQEIWKKSTSCLFVIPESFSGDSKQRHAI